MQVVVDISVLAASGRKNQPPTKNQANREYIRLF